MITAIVVVCLGVLLIVAITCFVFGWKTGRAKIEREIAQEAARKEADKKYYEGEKAKIKAEVFKHGNQKKAALSGAGGGRDKFNAVNNSLRNKS